MLYLSNRNEKRKKKKNPNKTKQREEETALYCVTPHSLASLAPVQRT
jgi:hypothetical protein